MTADGKLTWRELWAETTVAVGDRREARWMCERASGCSGGEFVAALDSSATERTLAHLDAMIARRQAGEPLQYVLGSWQFRTLDLLVDRRVLIPRPETEWVCEAALGIARSMLRTRNPQRQPLMLVDLGTGTGAIGLSLAAELPVGSAEIWLTDDSSDALDVARANLAGIGRSGAAARIASGSWFDALPSALRGSIDLVVSNPPYIAADDPAVDVAVREWEPGRALFAGSDGLDAIRAVTAVVSDWLAPGGSLVLEIGATQGPAVARLLDDAGLTGVEVRPDPAGRDRIAVGQASPMRSAR